MTGRPAIEDRKAAIAGGKFSGWRILAALAGALATVWLLHPALYIVQVEGFSASIAALATHMAEGSLASFDAPQPFDAEYFALTKLGTILAAATLVAGLGLNGDAALGIVMWLGFAALIAGSAAIARRWSGVSWLLALLPLLLIPGVFESLFFYNDNVPAAGLLALGLALLEAKRARLWLPIGGLLLGLAVLMRADTLVVGVAAPLILYRRYGATRAGAQAVAAVGLAAAAGLLVPLAWFGVSPLQVLAVGGTAVELWDRPNSLWEQIKTLLFYLGLPGLVLAVLGGWALARRREFLLLGLAAGVPLLFLAALYGSIWEVRQLLVLTPFFAALAAAGLNLLLAKQPGPGWMALRAGVAIVIVLTLLGPVRGLERKDGPRVVTGRAHAIALWRGWQQGMDRDFRAIDRLVAQAHPGETLAILTDYWNEDRYLHLALLERGFRPNPRILPAGSCARLGEGFASGPLRVVHLRLHQTFYAYSREIQAERLADWAIPCLRAIPAARPVLLASLYRTGLLLGEEAAPPVEPQSPVIAWLSPGPIVAIPVDGALLSRLEAGYERDGRAAAAGRPAPPSPPSAEAGAAATRNRTGLFDVR